MKKWFIGLILGIIIIAAIFVILYIQKPDLVITNVSRDKGVDYCKYSVEVENKGFSAINSQVSYCEWPEGKEKCKFLWDVIFRNKETGEISSLVLKRGEKSSFETSFPNSLTDGVCPNILHFCIDCNLHNVSGKEVVDGSIKELREGNNDYIYLETN